MKYALLLLSVSLISCSKGKQCWRCDMGVMADKKTVCEMTEAEISEFERQYSNQIQTVKCRKMLLK